MRLLTREQARELDQLAKPLFANDQLLELAGASLWKFVQQERTDKAPLLILAGRGFNGGDGWILARLAALAGRSVEVLEWFGASSIDLCLQKKALALKAGAKVISQTDDSFALQGPGIVVDAIVGTGMNRPWSEPEALRIQHLDAHLKQNAIQVLAVDNPSGLDVNTGQVLGAALTATWTLTMGLAKPGFFVEQGPAKTGKLHIANLPYPTDLIRQIADSIFLFGPRTAKKLWPRTDARANKSSNGRLFVAAGSTEYPGAALLTCRAALRAGVGYLQWSTRGEWWQLLPLAPEILLRPWAWDQPVKADAMVIGPGLGQGPETLAALNYSLSWPGPILIDADALNELAKQGPVKNRRYWVLTPHVGELARLLGKSMKEVMQDREAAAKEAALRYQAVVVAKGYRSFVTDGKRTAVIFAGNKALAKAGSGDVLSGFIGAFLAKKMDPFWAACLGSYLHGALADEWVRSGKSSWSFLPTDLIANESSTWNQVLDKILTEFKI